VFPTCSGNGDVKLPFGSPEYLGLGMVVFVTLVVVELFGDPLPFLESSTFTRWERQKDKMWGRIRKRRRDVGGRGGGGGSQAC